MSINSISYRYIGHVVVSRTSKAILSRIHFNNHITKKTYLVDVTFPYDVVDSSNLVIHYDIPDVSKPVVKKTFVFKPILFSIKQISPKYFSNIVDMRDFDDKLSIQIAFATTDPVLSISNLSVITTDEP